MGAQGPSMNGFYLILFIWLLPLFSSILLYCQDTPMFGSFSIIVLVDR